MKKARNYLVMFIVLSLGLLSMAAFITNEASAEDNPFKYVSENRWVSSTNCEESLCITVHDGYDLTNISKGKKGEYNNHKPVWSKEGDMITWFRTTGGSDAGPFNFYKSHICLINADGTGFRELTDNKNANLNPTWTRDGSNKITFNRFNPSGIDINIYMISPDGEQNSEVRVNNPRYCEWAESNLKDGRIFIWRISRGWFALNALLPGDALPNTQKYFLLDPKTREYYPVERPNKYPVHKLSVSASETKVVYMKDLSGNALTYNDCVIAYAEFDLNGLVVKNEVIISPEDKSYTDMYPRWSADEKYIFYSSSRGGKMQQYLYSLETKETHMVSDPNLAVDQYPNFEDLPK
jgi:WD40 repeat protein